MGIRGRGRRTYVVVTKALPRRYARFRPTRVRAVTQDAGMARTWKQLRAAERWIASQPDPSLYEVKEAVL